MLRAFLRSASVLLLSVIPATIAGCRNRCHEISASLSTSCSLTKATHFDITYPTLNDANLFDLANLLFHTIKDPRTVYMMSTDRMSAVPFAGSDLVSACLTAPANV